MTTTLAKLFANLAEYQRLSSAKECFPHAATGAMDGIYSILNGNGITEPQAKDLLRICRDICDTMELMDIQDWLKDEHDMIILLNEI